MTTWAAWNGRPKHEGIVKCGSSSHRPDGLFAVDEGAPLPPGAAGFPVRGARRIGNPERRGVHAPDDVRSAGVHPLHPGRCESREHDNVGAENHDRHIYWTTGRTTIRVRNADTRAIARVSAMGGDGGNRTPVQNRLPDIYYTFSRRLMCRRELPSTGSLYGELDCL
jgi:hypothetical protein